MEQEDTTLKEREVIVSEIEPTPKSHEKEINEEKNNENCAQDKTPKNESPKEPEKRETANTAETGESAAENVSSDKKEISKAKESQSGLLDAIAIGPHTDAGEEAPMQINDEAATEVQITRITIVGDKQASNESIPENILSPPKSESQTEETNTENSTGSDTQLTSPKVESSPSSVGDKSPIEEHKNEVCEVWQPINVVANGSIPNSGKPLMSSINRKTNKPVATTATTTRAARPRKKKALVAMYESEISDNKIGIKLCIKKSDTSFPGGGGLGGGGGGTGVLLPMLVPSETTVLARSTPTKTNNRKRSRKSKTKPRLDSDDSESEIKRSKKEYAEKHRKVTFSRAAMESTNANENYEVVEQSDWGSRLPEEILFKVFKMVVDKEGCLPTLFRLGRVCSLWRRVSLYPTLWKSLDLSTWIKEKYRTELKLKWFVDNRCSSCTDLNIGNWKVSDINCFLGKLDKGCPNLMGITLSGWKNFTSDHLAFLVNHMKKLERLDLSSINVEMNASKSAVGLQSLCNALQTMNGRLTHLYLAHNRLAGIPQIVTVLSTTCPNLLLLDLSNVTTQALSHALLHIEKLQHGCQKLKVLRVTNSHVTFNPATMQEMMSSPGFPDLEELSVAFPHAAVLDEHLQRILKTSSKLKLLDIRGCTRLTHESLIRLPAWDIKHLFLSGCSVTRDLGSGLELIASKWAHSLMELDLAWANFQQSLDNALRALAEKGSDSPLAHLNLCGSSVSDEAVKDILANCANMSSINLSSCRGLPRGVKRLMQGPQELQELRDVLKVQLKVKLPLHKQAKQQDGAVGEHLTSEETTAIDDDKPSANSPSLEGAEV